MKKKKTKGKKVAKKTGKSRKSHVKRHEIVVRVNTQPITPTSDELAQPMKDGKELALPTPF